ncbi:MAG: RecQ family ATP-dependent DNA helicase [Bacteroidales bacterium]|nr:RecQ family ATP-dependent DNA helicase [Bacteroidales bacterium]
MTTQEILIKYWGFSKFRPLQEDIIDSVLSGKDTLALMPTGGGKSVCFQVPSLKLEGLCIVVTPLIALMKDQVQQLDRRGIPAVAIFSGMHPREIDIALDNCAYGDKKFLYVSPERLETELFQERLKKMNISLLAVDEAHCISQWGYDFRPSYLQIADIRERIPNVPVLALTATATPTVVKDIQEKLLFKEENLFEMSFERSNLIYDVENTEDKHSRLLQLLNENKGTAVVYVRNRRKTKEFSYYLQQNGISSHFYHAGLETEERDKRQADWINNRTRVIVSTNAFGMGIDKADVRLVVHLDVPDSIEAYFQEAGRAGRDGGAARAVLLWHKSDLSDLQRNFNSKYPEISYIRNIYNALGNYFQLAVGSGVDSSLEIDINDFIKMYNLNPLLAYNSIKFLEKEGYLFLNEAMNRPSKVYVGVDREVLYRFQVKNPKLGDVLDVLIRSYSGLFTDFNIIDEGLIGRRLSTSALSIENALKFLHKNDILTYIPRSSKPRITFTNGRLQTKYVRINEDRYLHLKNTSKKRLDSVINYVTTVAKCRSEILLSYFGQEDTRRCGHCDVCENRNRLSLSKNEFDDVIELIKPILTEKNMSLQELIWECSKIEQNKLIKVVRYLLDSGKITKFDDKLIWVMN